MNRHPRNMVQCKKCSAEIHCPNCGEAIYPSTEFSDWLRNRVGKLSSINYSNHNLDYIWHNYRENWFITIEEKRYGARSSDSQRDTHGVIEQLLRFSSGCPVMNVVRGKQVQIEYRGHYEIVFSHTNPDDSDWIKINGRSANKGTLFRILLSGTFPNWIVDLR